MTHFLEFRRLPKAERAQKVTWVSGVKAASLLGTSRGAGLVCIHNVATARAGFFPGIFLLQDGRAKNINTKSFIRPLPQTNFRSTPATL